MKLHFLDESKEVKDQILFFFKEWDSTLPYFEAKTSGSTGQPKNIHIDKEHARSSARSTIQFLGLQTGDSALLCLNPQTIGGKMMLVRSMEHDLELSVCIPRSNPLKEITQSFDFLSLAPIQLHTILQENPEKLATAKAIIIGGGVIGEETIQLLKNNKLTVFQTFGMTETISHIAMRKVGYETEDSYHTLDGITVSEQQEQLIIHAPQIGQPALLTNDRVRIIDERTFDWLGRTDFIINSGGIKIQIEQLEHDLQSIISLPFFVHAMSHEKLGEQVVLLVEGIRDISLLRKTSYKGLSNTYFIPKKIAFIERFSRTLSEKINRNATFTATDSSLFEEIL